MPEEGEHSAVRIKFLNDSTKCPIWIIPPVASPFGNVSNQTFLVYIAHTSQKIFFVQFKLLTRGMDHFLWPNYSISKQICFRVSSVSVSVVAQIGPGPKATAIIIMVMKCLLLRTDLLDHFMTDRVDCSKFLDNFGW